MARRKCTVDFKAEMKAVERENLTHFLMDLVEHCLQSMNLKWERPPDRGLRQTILFKSHIGDAVLRYRNGYDELFRLATRSGDPIGDLRGYLYNFTQQHFTRESTMELSMRLFVFCGFLVDLAVFLCRKGRPDRVPEAVELAGWRVYDLYLAKTPEHTYWNQFLTAVDKMARYFDPSLKAEDESSSSSSTDSSSDEDDRQGDDHQGDDHQGGDRHGDGHHGDGHHGDGHHGDEIRDDVIRRMMEDLLKE